MTSDAAPETQSTDEAPSELATPAAQRAASRLARQQRDTFFRVTQVTLAFLVVVALVGAVHLPPGPSRIAGAISFVALLVSLIATSYAQQKKFDERWHQARATAEQIRSLAWQYAVGGGTYGVSEEAESQVAQRFLADINKIVDASPVPAVQVGEGESQITREMKELRRLPLAAREKRYLKERLRGQIEYFRERGAAADTRHGRWELATILLQLGGLVGAFLKAVGFHAVDFAGIAATGAAASTAWLQTRKYSRIRTSYGQTHHKLVSKKDQLELYPITDEAEWSRYVVDVEEILRAENAEWEAIQAGGRA